MSHTVWFCMPAHGRVELAAICMRQLRRTCDALEAEGIAAAAVVVACDENLDTARRLGFGTVERNNDYLGRRFNDALQLACDPAVNPHPADYAVPVGSDDWVDHRLFLDPPAANTMVGFQRLAVVREDGLELTVCTVAYPGGAGIRIWPRQLLEHARFRPCDEDRKRGCDTSILINLQRAVRFRIDHRHLHDVQIVDWKSPADQLNPYEALGRHKASAAVDPFEALAGVYPDDALDEMRAHYQVRQLAAA